MNNFFLKRGMLAAILGIFSMLGSTTYAQVKDIRPADAFEMLDANKAILIDVRTPGEVASGFIKGTSHFIDVSGSDFNKEIARLDKDKTYVIYCRSGARSGRAASMMSASGFSKVYNFKGGMMQVSDQRRIGKK
jgi:phage shock protein E